MDTTPTSQPTPKKPNSTLNWAILVVILVVAIAGVIYAMTRNSTTSNGNTNANQNTNVAVNSNTNSAANANVVVDTSQWKTYTNATYGYTVRIPQSWGHIVEFDGSLELNVNKQNVQTADTLTLGPSSKSTEVIFIQVHKKETLEQFLTNDISAMGSGDQKFILSSTDYTTSTGISGKKVNLSSSITGYDFAYVFADGENLVDLRFLKENSNALAVVNTLQF